MDKDLYNEDYFDFKKLAIDERFIKTKTGNCEFVLNKCIEAGTKFCSIGLITEPGYSARSGIEDFIKNMRSYRYYYDLCTRARGLKKILIGFLQQDLPPFVKINQTNEDNMVAAIGHHFKNIDSKRRRIMIFYNTENLTGLKAFGVLYKLVGEIKNHSGIVISINAKRFEYLQNMSEKHSDIKNFLSVFTWLTLPPPDRSELGQHCIARGVLGKRVIDKLLSKASDFRILNMEINKVRDLLVKKGYLKYPTS